MKLIHCNVESFNYFDALCAFIEQEKPDILSLVEATNGKFMGNVSFQRDYIGELNQKFGFSTIFHPTIFRDFGDHTVDFGAAMSSRYPTQEEFRGYFGDNQPSILPGDHIIFSDRPKYERYPYGWKLSLPFLATIVDTEQGAVRVLTAHFHVSYECLETLQIWQDAERVIAYLDSVQEMPTIFTGDCNIRNESMAIKTLVSKLTQQSEKFTNTLCRTIHPVFDKDPDHPGLGIDHIFTKDIQVKSCEVRDVPVSDHLPLVLEFSL